MKLTHYPIPYCLDNAFVLIEGLPEKSDKEIQDPPSKNEDGAPEEKRTQDADLKARRYKNMKKRDRRVLRMIGVFKLMKAAALIGVGVAALRLVHTDIGGMLTQWVPRMGVGPASHYVGRAILEAASLTPTHIKEVGVGSFIYAGLFLTEGIGLLLLKRWAEWMTVVLTSSLVPVEIWEILRHANVMKMVVFVVNVALVGYLVYLLRRERGEVESSEERKSLRA